ncbi:hypothetical protein P9112_014076 [Eukaryota sp. TZLM1-RC]
MVNNGIDSISAFNEFQSHTLLLTATGDVYGWGNNYFNQVFPGLTGPPAFDDSDFIPIPVKLPLSNIVSISAGMDHSLALMKDGTVYGWGSNQYDQINQSSDQTLPFTKLNLPQSNITNIYASNFYSLALTVQGKVVKWGLDHPPTLIDGLIEVCSIKLDWEYFVALTKSGDLKIIKFDSEFTKFDIHGINLIHSALPKPLLPRDVTTCFSLCFIVDQDQFVWKFNIDEKDSLPVQIQGLSEIKSIVAGNGFYVALETNGKVYLFGDFERIYNPIDRDDDDVPCLVKELTHIQSIAAGDSFFFAFNNTSAFYFGRYSPDQLSTRPLVGKSFVDIYTQPIKLFGSEIIGSFARACSTKKFNHDDDHGLTSCLIKLIFHHYLDYLEGFFPGHSYVKYRFISKLSLSQRFHSMTKEVLNTYPFCEVFINPNELKPSCNCKSLQLRLNLPCQGDKVNPNITKLYLLTNDISRDLSLILLFPNLVSLSVLKNGEEFLPFSLDCSGLGNLKSLEIGCVVNDLSHLPKSIQKLVIHSYVDNVNFRCLENLEHLVIHSRQLSEEILTSHHKIPCSILKLEIALSNEEFTNGCKLPKLRQLVVFEDLCLNLNVDYFPLLAFVEIKNEFASIAGSVFCPENFNRGGFVKSTLLCRNGVLVELTCFPWWIKYPVCEEVTDVFQ